MKVIYCGLKHENYDPRRGTSFEYNNFYLSLKNLPGVEVIDYFFDQIVALGKKKFNEGLAALVEQERPDLLFVFMYTDEIEPQTLLAIRRGPSTGFTHSGQPRVATLGWFSDDHWRLDDYSRFYAPYFDWIVTTYSKAPQRYAGYGIHNVIRSQWACNTAVWKPWETSSVILIRQSAEKDLSIKDSSAAPQNDERKDINVSFVGQRTAARAKIIDALRQAGINVYVRGFGWPEGKATQSELMEIISRSKINLNLNPPMPLFNLIRFSRLLFRRVTGWPGPFSRLMFWLKGSPIEKGKIVFSPHLISNFRSWRGLAIPQIKARPFELLGCGAFVISGYADDMERYYADGKEIVYYDSSNADLIAKINYYLPRAEERRSIADAGLQRTLREHSYQQRFKEIFAKIRSTRLRPATAGLRTDRRNSKQ